MDDTGVQGREPVAGTEMHGRVQCGSQALLTLIMRPSDCLPPESLLLEPDGGAKRISEASPPAPQHQL